MKATTMMLLTSLTFASSAYAGDNYSSKSAKEVIPPPAPSCLWSWFAGGSIGQFTGEWDEEIYTLHVGAERKCPGSNCSHAFYLEVGYTEADETIHREDGAADLAGGLGLTLGQEISVNVEVEIIPITLNYKYECSLTDRLNWYAGAGAGIALTDVKYSTSVDSVSDDDTAFYAHIFAGVVYNLSESFEIFGGARLIFMGDVFGTESPLDEEVHYELGGRFNF